MRGWRGGTHHIHQHTLRGSHKRHSHTHTHQLFETSNFNTHLLPAFFLAFASTPAPSCWLATDASADQMFTNNNESIQSIRVTRTQKLAYRAGGREIKKTHCVDACMCVLRESSAALSFIFTVFMSLTLCLR